MIVQIADKTGLDNLKQHFFNVFKDTDPFNEMFQDSVKSRLLLCPVEGYSLDEVQFNALVQAMKAEGEESFFITEIESVDCFSIVEPPYYQTRSWKSVLPITHDKLEELQPLLETAIYSSTGKWGLMISHEDHAVIGGTKLFIDTFKQNYPKWVNGYENFLEKWKYNKENYEANADWMKQFLHHVIR